MAKAKFEHPAFPKGEVFGIDGVGQVVNGEEFEVTDEMDQDALNANPHISMPGKKAAKAEEGGEES